MADLRSRQLRELKPFSEAVRNIAVFYDGLVVPGALLLLISGTWMIVRFYRSLAAEANDCFMVWVLGIQPNTRLRRDASRPEAGSPRFVIDPRRYAAKMISRKANGDKRLAVRGKRMQ